MAHKNIQRLHDGETILVKSLLKSSRIAFSFHVRDIQMKWTK